MLDILYEKVIVNRSQINEFFDNIRGNLDVDKIRSSYNECRFDKTIPDKTFAAVDGSLNKKKLMAAFIYALSSQTIIYDSKTHITKHSQAADVNYISSTQTSHINDILSHQMSILELKSTIDTLQKHPEIDYMLLDGMISGKILYLSINYEFPQQIEDMIQDKIDEIEQQLEDGNFPIEIVMNETIVNEIMQNGKFKPQEENEIKEQIIKYSQTLEELACINYLLENYSEKIVGVSKTSSTHNQFEQIIPDAAAVEYVCQNSGYTNPIENLNIKPLRRVTTQRRRTNEFPKYRSLSDRTFTTFFTRINNHGNVLKIELPYKIYSDKHETIQTILNDLNSISVDGYPYILKKAHDEVVIKQRDMDSIMKELGIFEKTGRDMLE